MRLRSYVRATAASLALCLGACGGSTGTDGADQSTSRDLAGGASDGASRDLAPAPVDCSKLVPIGTGTAGKSWLRTTRPTPVTWGNIQTATEDPTSYVAVWNVEYPTNDSPWPGNTGLTTKVQVNKGYYVAEQFITPTDGSKPGPYDWADTGSGATTSSYAISACPGDFGQTGTQVGLHCTVEKGNLGGVRAVVAAQQQGSFCTLAPGATYYLNILPDAPLPSADVSVSTCTTLYCIPWTVVN